MKSRWLWWVVLLWVALGGTYQLLPSPDLWWLLADGREIVHNGSIPQVDPFSWSAAGLPWHNDQWLAGWFFYQVWCLGGLSGLHLLKATLLTASLALALQTGWRQLPRPEFAPLLGALGLCLACAEGRFFFDVRAYLFTYLAITLLWRWLQRETPLKPGPTFLLFLLWSNVHGGVSGGLLLLGLAALTGPSPLRKNRWQSLAIGLVASCCNPSGAMLLLHPIILLGSSWGKALNEWTPVWRQPGRFGWHLAHLALWTLVWWQRPRDRQDRVLMGWALFSLTGWRHIPLFALLALPRWCVKLAHLKLPAWSGTGLALLLLLWTGVKPLQIADPRQSLEDEFFPRQACQHFPPSSEPVRLFHPYGLGGYLCWAIPDRCKVCIDGRAVQVYPWETYWDYYRAAFRAQDFDRYTREHDIHLAMLFTDPGHHEANLNLVRDNPAWKPIYQDPLVTLVVRSDQYPSESL